MMSEIEDMMKVNPEMVQGMMSNMVNMTANDSVMFNDMIQMMKESRKCGRRS